jgi:hypothetical protein
MKKETSTSPLIITPRKQKNVELYSHDDLANITKHAIIELALEKFGVELDMKLSKTKLIETFIELQE